MTRLGYVVAALCACALMAGCGSVDPVKQVDKLAKNEATRVRAGDGEAFCGDLSARSLKAMERWIEAIAPHTVHGCASFVKHYPTAATSIATSTPHTKPVVDGDRATVAGVAGGPIYAVKEDGDWKLDLVRHIGFTYTTKLSATCVSHNEAFVRRALPPATPAGVAANYRRRAADALALRKIAMHSPAPRGLAGERRRLIKALKQVAASERAIAARAQNGVSFDFARTSFGKKAPFVKAYFRYLKALDAAEVQCERMETRTARGNRNRYRNRAALVCEKLEHQTPKNDPTTLSEATAYIGAIDALFRKGTKRLDHLRPPAGMRGVIERARVPNQSAQAALDQMLSALHNLSQSSYDDGVTKFGLAIVRGQIGWLDAGVPNCTGL